MMRADTQKSRERKKKRHLVLFFLFTLFYLLYFVALLAAKVPPYQTVVPAFLNLGFPLLLVGAGLFAFLLILLRCWCWLVVHLFLMICTGGAITNYFPFHLSSPTNRPEGSLVLMSYNVSHFRKTLEDRSQTPAVRELFQKYDPDIICLQEGSFTSLHEKNHRLLKQYFHPLYPYIHSDAPKGLTLLSKYPILAETTIKYNTATNGSHLYILGLPKGERLLLVNNHMESYRLGKSEKEVFRDYMTSLNPRNLLDNIQTVKRRLGPSMHLRAKAAEKVALAIKEAEERYKPNRVIVTGDLNAPPNSYTYSLLRGERGDAFSDKGFGVGASYHDMLLPFRIDHTFYSGELSTHNCQIPREKGYSDHNPIITTFTLKSNP